MRMQWTRRLLFCLRSCVPGGAPLMPVVRTLGASFPHLPSNRYENDSRVCFIRLWWILHWIRCLLFLSRSRAGAEALADSFGPQSRSIILAERQYKLAEVLTAVGMATFCDFANRPAPVSATSEMTLW